MATQKQKNGEFGEVYVKKHVYCPKCKSKKHTFVQLPSGFPCADLICNFCGYLAQVKTCYSSNTDQCPRMLPGAGWEPLAKRMTKNIFYPIYVVVRNRRDPMKDVSIFYIPAELQTSKMFIRSRASVVKKTKRVVKGVRFDLSKAIAEPLKLRL